MPLRTGWQRLVTRAGSGSSVTGIRRSGEGSRQHRLAQRLSAFEVGAHLGLDLADDGQLAIDFGNDTVLFGEGRERDRQRFDAIVIDP